ncbi:unnamed protein product [Ceratitis capitata]|uniref:(Mediterranean fruit fly) hypothetical protein n=1 Tax=Ceratitis capitata TaxID=7213 RepID=A0A811UXZ2_CERCA|nr:unnamed protein product [Ceratitis capitata]
MQKLHGPEAGCSGYLFWHKFINNGSDFLTDNVPSVDGDTTSREIAHTAFPTVTAAVAPIGECRKTIVDGALNFHRQVGVHDAHTYMCEQCVYNCNTLLLPCMGGHSSGRRCGVFALKVGVKC